MKSKVVDEIPKIKAEHGKYCDSVIWLENSKFNTISGVYIKNISNHWVGIADWQPHSFAEFREILRIIIRGWWSNIVIRESYIFPKFTQEISI